MDSRLKPALDAVLRAAVDGQPNVPGVVAMVTDRDANVYEGAAGVRRAMVWMQTTAKTK